MGNTGSGDKRKNETLSARRRRRSTKYFIYPLTSEKRGIFGAEWGIDGNEEAECDGIK